MAIPENSKQFIDALVGDEPQGTSARPPEIQARIDAYAKGEAVPIEKPNYTVTEQRVAGFGVVGIGLRGASPAAVPPEVKQMLDPYRQDDTSEGPEYEVAKPVNFNLIPPANPKPKESVWRRLLKWFR